MKVDRAGYSIQPMPDGRLELCQGSKARLSTTGRLDPSSKQEARNGDMLARRPDDAGRWFSQWGYYTRSIRCTLIGVAAPATLYLPAPVYVRMPEARERRPVGILRGCDVIALKGPIHGTNRGKRTVAQLLAQGDFNRWLLLDEVAVRSLADETWGRAPGQQSQIKEKAAFLAAWRIVHERGHEVCLLDLKRYHYDSHQQLRQHLGDFVAAYNFGRRLKTLKGLTPYEAICKAWQNEPSRFTSNPHHQNPGSNT